MQCNALLPPQYCKHRGLLVEVVTEEISTDLALGWVRALGPQLFDLENDLDLAKLDGRTHLPIMFQSCTKTIVGYKLWLCCFGNCQLFVFLKCMFRYSLMCIDVAFDECVMQAFSSWYLTNLNKRIFSMESRSEKISRTRPSSQ